MQKDSDLLFNAAKCYALSSEFGESLERFAILLNGDYNINSDSVQKDADFNNLHHFNDWQELFNN